MKIVSLDTSFLRRHIDKLDQLYPPNIWIRSVQDTVFDEIFTDKFREKYEMLDFRTQNHIDKIMQYEKLQQPVGLEELFLPAETEAQIRLFLKGQYVEQDKLNKIRAEEREEIKSDSEDFWKRIQQKEPVHECKITKERIDELIKHHPWYQEIKSQYAREDSIQNLPLNVAVIVFDVFISLIRMPSGLRREKFTIWLNGEQIKIDKNTLYDFRISLAILPYVDEFATCDESQSNLIKELYPQYKDKAKYYLQQF